MTIGSFLSNLMSALCIMAAINNLLGAGSVDFDKEPIKLLLKLQCMTFWLVILGLVR